MKTLTAPAQTAAAATQAAPITILKIDFGGSTGIKWFADKDLSTPVGAEGRIISCSNISQQFSETAASPLGDVTVVLADHDQVIRGYIDLDGIEKKPATLYQHFDGNDFADLVKIMEGVVSSPVSESADQSVISIQLEDISTKWNATVGNIATKEDFPDIAKESEGEMLPLVFGKVSRVKGVHVVRGETTELLRYVNKTDMVLYIAPGNLPQDEAITIRIGEELIDGTLSGCVFTATAREKVLESGVTTEDSGHPLVLVDDVNLTGGADDRFVGYYVRMSVPGIGIQYRRIKAHDAGTGSVTFVWPFLLSGGWIYDVEIGRSFDISSLPSQHYAGDVVHVHLDAYVYIVNDVSSKAVRMVEAWGVKHEEVTGGGETLVKEIEGWIPMMDRFYTVNLNDTTTFSGLGRAVTTVTLLQNPEDIRQETYHYRTNDLFFTVEGVESSGDSSGTLLENPVNVLEHLLRTFGSLTTADFDMASLTDVKAKVDWLKFGFALNKQWELIDLCANLAFQARIGFLWDEGKVRLTFLINKIETSVMSLDSQNFAEEPIELFHSDYDRLVTEVVAQYQSEGETKAISVEDATGTAKYGRRTRIVPFFAYAKSAYVSSIATFWLERWSKIRYFVRIEGFLPALKLERLDPVDITIPNFLGTGQAATVVTVDHAPGSSDRGEAEGIGLTLQFNTGPGCSVGCEFDCETGCETGCEIFCESTCELDCELTCETTCQVGCEQFCTLACQVSCVYGCQLACQASCEVGCEGGCETACESGCEQECESGCEVDCESGCETGCETGCELYCQSVCEQGCEAGCETTCEVSCETTCQSGCEATCETSCETGCEDACEIGCQSGCEASCETGCEVTCQVGCEASCESGCEVECETGCEAECETGCETSCETGCEVECETGCETGEQLEHACCPEGAPYGFAFSVSGFTDDCDFFNCSGTLTWSGSAWTWAAGNYMVALDCHLDDGDPFWTFSVDVSGSYCAWISWEGHTPDCGVSCAGGTFDDECHATAPCPEYQIGTATITAVW